MSLRTLSKELQEKATKELNEVPEDIQAHLRDLKEWLASRPHLKANTDDQWLVSFLRGCKFNMQKTKDKLEYFYVMRKRAPEFFKNRDPMSPEIQQILERGILLPVKNTADPAGPPLLMVRWEKTDPKRVSFVDIVRTSLMSLEIMLKESDAFVIAGQQIVQDFKGFSFWYITQMTPGVVFKCMQCLQSAYPTRIKGVHFINVPSYFRLIFNMVHPFLTQKLKSRVKVHGADAFNDDGLLRDVPRVVFPEEYGGEGDSVDDVAMEWKKKVESYGNWFLQDKC